MVQIRQFRNTDPPVIASLWNDALTGRSTYPLSGSTPLERCVFAKPYFDPAGLLIAEDAGEPVGFVHAGFGPNTDESGIDPSRGVISLLAVRPSHRRQGIGSELLRRAEQYVHARGTRELHAGPHWPLCPFYFGLYGGSGLPGFLLSDSAAEPFFLHHGYAIMQTTLVLQRNLDRQGSAADARFMNLRKRYQARVAPRALGTRWQESVLGLFEPVEFRLEEMPSNEPAAWAVFWEMEGYTQRYERPMIGLTNVIIRPDRRRQGLAKFLLNQVLRGMQEQSFATVEAQVPALNTEALALLRSIGFEQVDAGKVYQRELDQ